MSIYKIRLAAGLAVPVTAFTLLLSQQALAQTNTATAPVTSAPAAVQPAPVPVAAGTSESSELASLQAQIQLLTARAAIAKLKQEIATASGAPAPGSVVANAPVVQPAVNVEAASNTSSRASGGMSAVSIGAYNGVYRAVVSINGEEVPVQPGQTIEGGWKVARITDSEITLVRGKQTIVLRG